MTYSIPTRGFSVLFDRRNSGSRAAHDPALRCGRRSACRAETVELERPGPVGLTSPVLQSPSFMPAILFFRFPELCDRSAPCLFLPPGALRPLYDNACVIDRKSTRLNSSH